MLILALFSRQLSGQIKPVQKIKNAQQTKLHYIPLVILIIKTILYEAKINSTCSFTNHNSKPKSTAFFKL